MTLIFELSSFSRSLVFKFNFAVKFCQVHLAIDFNAKILSLKDLEKSEGTSEE